MSLMGEGRSWEFELGVAVARLLLAGIHQRPPDSTPLPPTLLPSAKWEEVELNLMPHGSEAGCRLLFSH